MNVSWLTPDASEPETAYGAVLEAEFEVGNFREFIPIPLEPESIPVIVARGPVWLVEQLPDAFPVFFDSRIAEVALYEMYEMHQRGRMSIGAMHDLVEALGGVWHDRSEYGYEMGPNRGNLN